MHDKVKHLSPTSPCFVRTLWVECKVEFCVAVGIMKRDMALIRTLLEHVENLCGGEWLDAPTLPHRTDQQIHYHIDLCQQAGFLETTKTTGPDSLMHALPFAI